MRLLSVDLDSIASMGRGFHPRDTRVTAWIPHGFEAAYDLESSVGNRPIDLPPIIKACLYTLHNNCGSIGEHQRQRDGCREAAGSELGTIQATVGAVLPPV